LKPPVDVPEVLAANLCEIIEALETPGITNCVEQLVETVDLCKAAFPQGEDAGALDEARKIFLARMGKAPESFLFSRNRAAEAAAASLRSTFSSWPYYVYHGTSSKALPAILEDGLIPHGGKSYWKGIVSEDYLSSGVFLTSSWRSALTWAQVAALTKAFQLRKDGSVPVIIRIRARGLELLADARARTPNCLMHAGEIDVSATSCFAITESAGHAPRGLPAWRPIQEVMERFPAKRSQAGIRAGATPSWPRP